MTEKNIRYANIKPGNINPGNINPAKQNPDGTEHDKTEHGGGSRYRYRIPIRMTAVERATIGRSACAADLSVSRYLVELATKGRVPRPEDRVRLQYLRALFRDAAEKTQVLLTSPLLNSPLLVHGEKTQGDKMKGDKVMGDKVIEDGEVAQARSHLAEAARMLEALSAELGRRLDTEGNI